MFVPGWVLEVGLQPKPGRVPLFAWCGQLKGMALTIDASAMELAELNQRIRQTRRRLKRAREEVEEVGPQLSILVRMVYVFSGYDLEAAVELLARRLEPRCFDEFLALAQDVCLRAPASAMASLAGELFGAPQLAHHGSGVQVHCGVAFVLVGALSKFRARGGPNTGSACALCCVCGAVRRPAEAAGLGAPTAAGVGAQTAQVVAAVPCCLGRSSWQASCMLHHKKIDKNTAHNSLFLHACCNIEIKKYDRSIYMRARDHAENIALKTLLI